MSSDPFERLKERGKKRERWTIGNIGKWLALGSEIPIMVLAGAFIGRYFGEQFGEPYSAFWIAVGTVLGLLVGTYNLVKIVRVWAKMKTAEKSRFVSDTEKESGEQPSKEEDISEDEKWRRVLELLKKQMLDEN
ncbi:MAG: AtpZ/AtpI family protein [Candidatus Freyarchaeota archaeon]